jgi:tyrosine-protein kinase shark
MLKLLLDAGALPNERNAKNGRYPLHEAAEADNVPALKILLEDCKVALLPSTVDGLSPIELARDANKTAAITFLNEFILPPAESRRSDWFHQVLSRNTAEQLLLNLEHRMGMFLVRESASNRGYVLTLYADRIYHYIICEVGNLWYIEKGPHMPSVEHLIDYYSKVADGLPVKLMHPVSPQNVAVNLLYDALEFLEQDERNYYAAVEWAEH